MIDRVILSTRYNYFDESSSERNEKIKCVGLGAFSSPSFLVKPPPKLGFWTSLG
jgi:hypothetical protein